MDALYLQISWYFFFKYLRILLQCKELQFLEIDRIDEQGVCMEDLIYYLYKNQVNLFNVMPSIYEQKWICQIILIVIIYMQFCR